MMYIITEELEKMLEKGKCFKFPCNTADEASECEALGIALRLNYEYHQDETRGVKIRDIYSFFFFPKDRIEAFQLGRFDKGLVEMVLELNPSILENWKGRFDKLPNPVIISNGKIV